MKNIAKTICGIFVFITFGTIIIEYSKKEDIQSKVKSNQRPTYVDDLQWHRYMMRGGKLEPQKVIDGRAYVKKKLEKIGNQKDAGINTWTSSGPGNVGGRIRAIANKVDKLGQETIYIGAAGGGIWRSTNEGKDWSPMTDFSPSLAVTSIVIHPSNQSIMYASTGEGHAARTMGLPGAGIFKSTDSGVTWNQLPSTAVSDFWWVNKIAINPSNGNHLLAVTSDINKTGGSFGVEFDDGGKLYESLNGGNTWIELNISGSYFTDVEFSTQDPDVRVVSGIGELWVYNSTTGLYEDKISEVNHYPGRIEVALAANNSNIMYALINTEVETTDPDPTTLAAIYQSTDAGDTWTFKGAHDEIFTSIPFGNYSNTIWVDPLDNDDIWLGGLELWRSQDAGSNVERMSDWRSYHTYLNADITEDIQLHADQHIIIPAANYSTLNRKVYIGNDGGIQKTDDLSAVLPPPPPNGVNFSGWDNLLGSGMQITQYYGIGKSNLNGAIGGGAQDAGVNIKPQGSTWRQPRTGDGTDVIFHPTDPDIVYANLNYNLLVKSTDGGSSFTQVSGLGESNAPLISKMAIDPQNPDIVYLAGYSLFKYDDNTGTTTLVKNPISAPTGQTRPITALKVDHTSRSIWVGYSDGTIEYSQNGGSSWSGDISTFQMPSGPITDFSIRPLGFDGLDIHMTIGSYTQDNIWKHNRSHGVSTWTSSTLGFDMHINTITRHPERPEWLYIGTDVGIFASEDDGVSWSITPLYTEGGTFNNEGPVFTEVTDFEWDYESFAGQYVLYAGTFGRGIWSTATSTDIFVDKDFTSGAIQFGTRMKPFRTFLSAPPKAENKGGDVIFLTGGTYNEISSSRLYTKRMTIKSELQNGQSAIIE